MVYLASQVLELCPDAMSLLKLWMPIYEGYRKDFTLHVFDFLMDEVSIL